jgi:hypothetical protein
VLLRGVQWGAADADVLGLSAALAQVWPTPYPREGSELVAHAGVARLANALRAEVKGAIAMSGAADEDGGGRNSNEDDEDPLPIVWAGHSLGGALAKLLWVAEVAEGGGGLARQQQRRQRQRRRGGGEQEDDDTEDPSSSPPLLPEVLTFGSPPVLAHARGGGSAAMMRALARMAEGGGNGVSANAATAAAATATTAATSAASVAQYVLEGDPVPRALLSADPTFASLKKQGGIFSAALALNQRLFGEGSPLTPTRFLFEPLGVVKLVRWSAAGGSEVVPLTGAPEDVARGLLAAAATTAGGRPGGNEAAAADAASAAAVAAETGGESAGWSPLASLRAWLDHHHGSYTQELEAAAISALRAEQRAAALQRRGQQQQQQAR